MDKERQTDKDRDRGKKRQTDRDRDKDKWTEAGIETKTGTTRARDKE